MCIDVGLRADATRPPFERVDVEWTLSTTVGYYPGGLALLLAHESLHPRLAIDVDSELSLSLVF